MDHVVAQVVEAELVVGAIGDIRGVGGLLAFARHLRQVHSYRQSEEAVHTPHPLGVALGEVVVDSHDMHALAGDRVQVDRQRRHECLALAGAHLGDASVVKRHAADQLHIKVPHLEHSLARLPHGGKGLGEQRVERGAGLMTSAELLRLCCQSGVVQGFKSRLERVDLLRNAPVLLQQSLVAATKYLRQYLGQHAAFIRCEVTRQQMSAGLGRSGGKRVWKMGRGAVELANSLCPLVENSL